MRRVLLPLTLAAMMLAARPALTADPELSDKDKLNRILEDMKGMKQDLEELRKVGLQFQAVLRDVRDLQRKLENLEQSVERISAARSRVSASYTPSAPATGTIRIQNRYDSPVTVSIDGQPYTVAAHQVANIASVPAGNFRYEVQAEGFGVIRPTVTRSLAASETFTISIDPPAPQLMLVQ